ncbi:MAG TPA: UdgX family uracil-DNA binding protein [Roseiarcus sp.]
MNIQIGASLQRKLAILADAAKYDASCASSGAGGRNSRDGKGLGSTTGSGICHAYTPDGRCVSLLKVLLTNFCVYDCAFCVNRLSSNTPRARFKVEEVVALTLGFYRRNLPETRQIAAMSSAARLREDEMVAAPAAKAEHGAVRVAARFAEARTPREPVDAYEALLREAKVCRLCPLADCATQTVFGEGPMQARAIFVGEQPGDQEDLQGRPFVGPAGMLLRSALREAGFSEAECYLTNAVKHFKFVPRGKRRIHKTPGAREIDHCRWWLDRELALVKSPLVVTLGASALRAVAGPSARLVDMRGRPVALGARTLLPTIHPAYLLRLPDPNAKEAETRAFANDLKQAAFLAYEGLEDNDSRSPLLSCNDSHKEVRSQQG